MEIVFFFSESLFIIIIVALFKKRYINSEKMVACKLTKNDFKTKTPLLKQKFGKKFALGVFLIYGDNIVLCFFPCLFEIASPIH